MNRPNFSALRYLLLLLLLSLLLPAAASAQLRQPDGTAIPQGSALDAFLDDEGEDINVRDDASLVPEIFFPSASLTLTIIGEGGGYRNAFGWYNVGDDITDPANRFEVLDCDREVGDVITIDFCGNPNWRGGPIGFFILTPELVDGGGQRNPNCARNDNLNYQYFTEPRLNFLEDPVDPYIHHLVYESGVFEDAFYFGFEDLFRGGDNDFEDYLVRVEGLLVGGPRELCNGLDDDCDGDIDEDVVQFCSTTCGDGLQICDPDTATFGACSAPTPGTEVCDGIDNDCDGDIDEGLTQSCSSDCGTGVEVCLDGEWAGCSAPIAQAEVCDNVDNDCDGDVDEGLTAACANGCGVAGVATCIAGEFAECDAPDPTDEVCDGIDNDCDGDVDEALVQPCSNGCGTGVETCVDGEFVGCTAPESSPEICDGVDNDCNGAVDEGLTQDCSNECGAGVSFCRGGEFIGCTARTPSDEICDGVDNDCDGDIDEALTRDCDTACGAGSETCSDGLWIGCDAPTPLPESCDGVDNNCDGDIDEDLFITCGNLCGEGRATCVDGEFALCDAPTPEDEICDGIDNDCDGLVDEDLTQACNTECGTGVEICSDGEWGVCNAPPAEDEVCDGIDNDCDGQIDEGLVQECSNACGLGIEICEVGRFVDCSAPAGSAEICDGFDNDCDGIVDNDAICPEDGTCVSGECVFACSSGECPAGFTCQDDLCIPEPCSRCRPYEACSGGRCVDLCAGVTCADGETCQLGECIAGTCYEVGCDDGKVCVEGECVPDDCFGLDCGELAFCTDGECVASCIGVECPDGTLCTRGVCLPDLCAAEPCDDGEFCDGGVCVSDPCEGIECTDGFACVDGLCEDDPCLRVTCPIGSICVFDDRTADCVPGEEPEPEPGDDVGVDAGDDVGSGEPDAGNDVVEADTTTNPETGVIDGGNEPECEEVSVPADDSGCSAAPGRAPGPWLLILGALFALRTRRRPAQHGTLRQSAAAVDGDALQVAAGKDGRLCARLLGVALGVAVVSFLAAGCGDDGGTTTQLVCDDDAADTGIGTDVACTPTPETCNGMDDNCDGVVDNIPGLDSDPNNCGGCGNICDFPNSVPTCDFGVCRVVTCEPGFSNADGVAENGCEFPCETSNDGVEICDGIDNDCNGILDDGFDLSGDSDNCGVCGRSCVTDNVSAAECIRGRCTITECADGFENANGIASDGCESTCVVTNGGVETCDGIDNDCDGRIDNRLFDFPPPCLDLGVCRGARAVCRGEEGYVCAYPTLFTEGIDAVCDGLDNDCDGEIDEDFFGVGEPCDGDDSDLCEDGILSCNADGSGTFCREVRDNIEICDGEDNDCDGEADEGFDLQTDSDNCGICGRSCSALNAIGACEAGVCRIDACEDGFFDVNGDPNDGCEYACEPSEGGAEVCDGLDNDCNGIVDDGIDLGDSGCLSDGVCSSGRPVCDPAEGIVCLYPTTYEEGAETLCDGLDNNCDGNIDESFAGLGEFCDGDDDDLCADGVLVCGDGGAVCTDDADSNVELCDGADNDCDGDTDEGFDLDTDLNNCGRCGVVCNLPNATAECDSGVCSIASCDEGFTNRNGFDVDGCEFECTPSNGGVEICDGLDNDCDGQTDEGLTPPDPDLCDGPGVCAGLIPRCQGADGFQCVYPAVYEEVETTCDNLDNDCDGSVDEATDNPALANKGTTCQDGLGICLSRGIFLCSDDGTSVVCSAEAGAALPNEICNGLDDDCDGDIDEGIPRNSEMVQVTNDAGTYWIDRWEASRPDATATERGFDDAYACSRPDVLPWNNLSWDEAAAACAARGRRLCTDAEWTAACSGNGANAYPYGDTVSDGTCNDGGVAVQPTGSAAGCVTPNGIFDQSGNVAEWADCENPNDCRIVKPFFGGSYSDDVGIFLTCPFRNNGAPALFSSSVGFRCCDD